MGSQADSIYSPEPLLAAAEAFCGSWIDLDRAIEVDAAAFARGWKGLAAALRRYGLEAGDRVVTAVGNGPLFPAALVAIVHCGGSPLLVHGETPPAELHRTARRFGARFILSDSPGHQHDLEIENSVSAVSSGEEWANVLWAQLPESHGAAPLDARLAGVPLHPTSGTTGHPRVAARPAACAVAEARHWVESVGVSRSDTILAAPPMSHAFAFGGCVITPFLTGARVLCMRKFSPKLVFRALERYEVTLLPTVPVALDMLLFGAGKRLRRPGLRVVTAGSPLAKRTAEQFKRASGITVRPLYGATETGVIAVGPAEFDAPTGCVGLPFSRVEVRVDHAPADAELSAGVGRVYVRSPSMMAGYVADDGQVDASPLSDGWFRTGDIGRLDDAGMLHLLGRETDVINVFGMKVIPSEVEEVVAAIPAVVEVKVYAGTRWDSQYVKAAVAGNGGLDVAAIRAHCEKHLVYYKRPETIHLIERLPRTPSGKVIYSQLP